MMRLQCAWCLTVMREGDEPVSHGLCPACLKVEEDRYFGSPATDAEKAEGRRMERERKAQSRDVRRV